MVLPSYGSTLCLMTSGIKRYMLVFSLTDRSSLAALQPYAKLHFLLHGGEGGGSGSSGGAGNGGARRPVPPLVLVGNKLDLVEHFPAQRQVRHGTESERGMSARVHGCSRRTLLRTL